MKSRVGVGFVTRRSPHHTLLEKKFFGEKMFPTENIFSFNADDLHLVKEDIRVHSRDSTNFEAFSWPQIIVKRSWNRPTGRFHVRFPISKNKAEFFVTKVIFQYTPRRRFWKPPAFRIIARLRCIFIS